MELYASYTCVSLALFLMSYSHSTSMRTYTRIQMHVCLTGFTFMGTATVSTTCLYKHTCIHHTQTNTCAQQDGKFNRPATVANAGVLVGGERGGLISFCRCACVCVCVCVSVRLCVLVHMDILSVDYRHMAFMYLSVDYHVVCGIHAHEGAWI